MALSFPQSLTEFTVECRQMLEQAKQDHYESLLYSATIGPEELASLFPFLSFLKHIPSSAEDPTIDAKALCKS